MTKCQAQEVTACCKFLFPLGWYDALQNNDHVVQIGNYRPDHQIVSTRDLLCFLI